MWHFLFYSPKGDSTIAAVEHEMEAIVNQCKCASNSLGTAELELAFNMEYRLENRYSDTKGGQRSAA